MKISVITPVYNSAAVVGKNVNSIIEQSYKNFEHIIIDNLSSDNTLEIIKDIYLKNNIYDKLQIISEKDEGIADAFNKGIKASTGEIITILNSDDEYYHNRVLEKVADMFKDKDVLFVHGDILFEDTQYGSNIRRPLLCPVTNAMPFNHPSMFFRKELYEKFGLYDGNYKYAMDYEFIIRLEKGLPDFKLKGKYFSEEPMAIMRFGGASWSNELKSIEESKSALRKHGLWNMQAKKHYLSRIFRTKLKKYLSQLGLNYIVKIWRRIKWKNPAKNNE